ncbi:MAG TPA: CDP-alcohol phosphatidyltransferase family protein [Chloroflexi bacterium]|nr:CDP-alcohol phosphatidyltransferase family protein [Chloroflexota bacterium]
MSSTQRVEAKRRARQERERKRERWDSLTDWARDRAAFLTVPIARLVGRLGVHPNTLTIVGLALQVGVAVVFGLGHLRLGGCLLLIVAPVDALDGAVARTLGKQSRFGAFLDSTLDRIADAVLILGLAAHHIGQGDHLPVALLLTALVSVVMVSYTRARAEALGFPCKVGLLTRMERIVLIGVLLAVGLPLVMVWALAVLSLITMLQRILYVYAISRREEREEHGEEGSAETEAPR